MNTDDQNKLLAEIESGETWLAEVMRGSPEPECGSLSSLKHRVRIAVHEEALSFPETPQPSSAVLEHIKRSVRAELGAQGAVGSPRPTAAGGWWWRNRFTLAGLAAAAAVALSVVPSYWMADAPVNGAASRVDVFAEVLAAAASEDFELELVRLRREVDEFADLLLPPDDLTGDMDIEELEDEVDRLLMESALPLDV